MIYELRTYWAYPGKADALHNRFRTLTLQLFERYGMNLVGFWSPEPVTEATGDLVYILAFRDRAAMAEAWDCFRNDPDWQAGKAASEVDGALTERLTSVVLQPTDYSPLR
jgi:hypothetical protein